MQFRNLLLVAALVMPAVPLASTASADKGEEKEKVVKLQEIPAPARQSLVKMAKGAPILRVELEREKGRTVYEGVIREGKDEVGIVVDAKGNFVGKHSEKSEKDEH